MKVDYVRKNQRADVSGRWYLARSQAWRLESSCIVVLELCLTVQTLSGLLYFLLWQYSWLSLELNGGRWPAPLGRVWLTSQQCHTESSWAF